MYADNKTIFKSMMFGAFFASIVSYLMHRKNRPLSMMNFPMMGMKKGKRMVKRGTRNAMDGVKHGLRVLTDW